MLLSELSQAKVAVWGYGVEGKATSTYLSKRCPQLQFSVLCQPHEVDDQPHQFITEPVTSALLNQFDVVIKSPGISPYQEWLKEVHCQLTSASALWFSNERQGQVIAITGTKGKSTSSALLAHVLESMGHKVVLAGNIGVPLIACLDDCDFVVLETSSYQAQDGAIQADLAVLLNVYSEHLDWHGNEAQYQLDKWRLMEQASAVVLNHKDANTLKLLESTPLSQAIHWFNQSHGYYVLNGVLMYQDKALVSKHGWQLAGDHNLVNAAAVCTVINCLDLNIMPAVNHLKTFQPLPHRLQPVATINGVHYINDSIASTPKATQAALATVAAHRTLLLVGGYDRGLDWQWWVESISQEPPKAIICSGANSEKIADLILNHGIKTQCIKQASLKSAVEQAKRMAEPGDVVLLSPGAPSFDAFNDYQHRGQQFIQWIK